MKKAVPILLAALIVVLLAISLPSALVKPCATCDGDGDLRCSDCKGNGSVDCENCDAKGVFYCTKCKGDKKQSCSDCSGKGYTLGGECSDCGGDGRVITSIDLSDVQNSNSQTLRNLYKNPSQSFGFWEYDCPDCNGSGKEHITCTSCHGDGEVSCSKCGGTGGRETCSICNGAKTVECTHCAGDGHYDCPDCDGTGKRFIWK